jgi:hypothetical protein
VQNREIQTPVFSDPSGAFIGYRMLAERMETGPVFPVLEQMKLKNQLLTPS